MPFYALATKPLIDRLTTDTCPDLNKSGMLADDATAGKISDLKKWWDNLAKLVHLLVTLLTPRKRG